MPETSVIIPTYNRADVLSRAIESVLEQSYQDFELIIVDDGSTDGTESVVHQYDDDRLIYITQSNAGANAARNRGIKAATGEYIAFLDSDDEFLPLKLARCVNVLSQAPPSCGGVYSSFRKIRDGKVETVSIADPGPLNFR